MNQLTSDLYFAAAAISLFYLLVLFACRQHLRADAGFPQRFITLLCCNMLLTLMLHIDGFVARNLCLFLISLTAFCSAPLAYRYVGKITGNPRGDVASRALTSSAIAGGVLSLPLLTRMELDGQSWLNAIVHAAHYPDFYYGSLTLAALLYGLQVGLCLFSSYRRLQIRTALDIFPNAGDQPRMFATKFVLSLVALQFLLNAARIFHCRVIGEPSVISVGLGLLDIALTLATLLALLSAMFADAISKSAVGPGVLRKALNKYRRSALPRENRERIRERLEAALQDDTLLHDNDLDLHKLSRHLGVKAHYLSQVMNQDLQRGFFELINGARVRQAAKLLQTEPDTPIVEIYSALGFNSKSTFYKTFTKEMGMSPSAYRAQVTR